MSARSHSFHAFGPAGSVLAKPRRRSPRRNPHRLAYPPIDCANDPADPLYQLSPLLLHRLHDDGAEARRTELLGSQTHPYRDGLDPYATWLRSLDLAAGVDEGA